MGRREQEGNEWEGGNRKGRRREGTGREETRRDGEGREREGWRNEMTTYNSVREVEATRRLRCIDICNLFAEQSLSVTIVTIINIDT